METSTNTLSKGLTIALAVVISAVISGGGVFLALHQQKSVTPSVQTGSQQTQVSESTKEETTENTDSQDLTLVYVPEGRQTLGEYQIVLLPDTNDQRILRYNQATEKTEVLVKSVKEKYPELKQSLIGHVSVIDNTAIFQSFLPESDAPAGPYYRLDLKNLSLTKSKVNDILLSKEGALREGVLSPSPSGLKTIWVPEDSKAQTAYLLDLKNDSYKEIVKLKNNETFNGGEGFFGFNSEINWLTDDKIRYAVFDDKLNDDTTFENFYKALIEYRELALEVPIQ